MLICFYYRCHLQLVILKTLASPIRFLARSRYNRTYDFGCFLVGFWLRMPPGCKSASKMIFFFKTGNFLLKTLVRIQRYPTNTNLMSKHKKLLLNAHFTWFYLQRGTIVVLYFVGTSKVLRMTELVVCYPNFQIFFEGCVQWLQFQQTRCHMKAYKSNLLDSLVRFQVFL